MNAAQYIVARYTPNHASGEVLNVGILVHKPDSNTLKWRFIPDTSRVRHVFGVESARALESYLNGFLLPSLKNGAAGDSNLFSSLAEQFDNSLQFTAPRAMLAGDLDEELESLYSRFVSTAEERRPKAKAVTDPMLRKTVRQGLKEFIERKVVIPGKKIGKWSRPQYQFERDNKVGLIYLQSLAKGERIDILRSAEQLAGLIFLAREKVRSQVPADFFAIVHPPLYHQQKRAYGDCVEIIEDAHAKVFEVSELDSFKQKVLKDARPLAS